MNIHVSKLLQKMEGELFKAKNSQSDKEMRERLVVIQSLCEVILEEEGTSLKVSSAVSEINPTELQKMMGNNLPPVVKSSTQYKEKDANGESLFDF